MAENTESLIQSAMRWDDNVSNHPFITVSDRHSSQNLTRCQCQGASNVDKALGVSDDYVVLDGYETDVESEFSGNEELQECQ